ncbi:MAG: hypothetical protein COV45_08965 [Deltaproteobacteria bacterium CG11_big_fil_rev_8_21_14_0_20_47_16]|nr:MAG: hypothetical protein COV45_08965 [Deltaproteobacteria bacterium CG11_big_fil_rev_8_21_14_0_20_47_16]
MIVPASIGVGGGLVGSANISSPLGKSIMAAIAPGTYLSVNEEVDTTTTILNNFVDDALASVFLDNGTPVELTSSISKHSATVTLSSGVILYIDYKAFEFTAFTTTDPVGINPGSQTCSGNNADPATTGKAICMRVWKLSPGQVVTESTDLRYMEALFTVKPTATNDGAGSFHIVAPIQNSEPFQGGYSYNRSGDNREVFANVNILDPVLEFEAYGDRLYVSDEVDSGDVLHYLNKAGFQSNAASLLTAYFYDTGSYIRENIKFTNTRGTEEIVVRNACVNRTTGVQDVSGTSCTGIAAITDSFFEPAVPTDYTFQADFYLQPPNGIDPTN